MFCIKDGVKSEDPSACEADSMPLSDEPCEAPCPVVNATAEGSGNGTTNATEVEEPAEEGGNPCFDRKINVSIMFQN